MNESGEIRWHRDSDRFVYRQRASYLEGRNKDSLLLAHRVLLDIPPTGLVIPVIPVVSPLA